MSILSWPTLWNDFIEYKTLMTLYQPYVKWVNISFTGRFTKCWQEILHDVMLVKINIPHTLRCYSTHYCNTFIGNTFYCTFYCIPDIWCWLIYLNNIWLQKNSTQIVHDENYIYNPYTYVKLTEKYFRLTLLFGVTSIFQY